MSSVSYFQNRSVSHFRSAIVILLAMVIEGKGMNFGDLELWFVVGSQHLYGSEVLKEVEAHARAIADRLSASSHIPLKVVCQPVMTGSDSIHRLFLDANSATHCVGVITWMHTFSPARMWVAGLQSLQKPLLHLHTQFNQDLPWATIDMDFMNVNQSAHGDREFGFIGARTRHAPKIVAGFWQDIELQASIGVWARAACAWHDAHQLKIVRFGDNMRDVAVTEGDKLEAQLKLGWVVNGYGVGDLAQRIESATEAKVAKLISEYEQSYAVTESLQAGGSCRQSLCEAARIEVGLRDFLSEVGAYGFTDTFEDLHGLTQLPGIAVQRLMAEGYGFGAEGDWKAAALVRAMKVMNSGLKGGTSFMEDYTYHLRNGGQVLGAHMLEVCPTLAGANPSLEIHPLHIGGKADPVRLVFTALNGPGVNASLIDMGNRFRLVVNKIEVIRPEEPLPKLPVARALWRPKPNLKTAATAWIAAGGAHHTCLSTALDPEHLEDFAQIAGIEYVLIDEETRLNQFQKELRWNDLYYGLANGF
jgi:L-arabinose isomerase